MTAACYIDHRTILSDVRTFGSHATVLRREPLAYLSVPLYTAETVGDAWREAMLRECMARECGFSPENPERTMQELLHYDRVMSKVGLSEELVRLEAALFQANQTIKALKEQIT